VVGILSPTPTHLAYALRAIARGRHVVCEKPLAGSAGDAQRMVDAAAAAGVRLFPAHVVRYFDAYRRLKADVDTGAVGAVHALRLSRSGAGPTAPWFFDERTGGGLIRDLLIHDIDQALWIAGPVATVTARQDPPSVDGRLAVPVTATVELVHTGGAMTRIDGGWLGEGTPFRTTIEVDGADGVRRHDSTTAAPATVDDYLPPTDDHPYRAQIADFAEAIRTGAAARVGPADGVAAVAVVDAAYASISAGGSAVAVAG
jgi:myo-inositol 2-dehydrogenase/D-chiro-inositol 1-dehydrogenase